MQKNEHSYISRYIIEQDSVAAPADLFESTYQLLQTYQLTNPDLATTSELDSPVAPTSTTPLTVLLITICAIAAAGLLYVVLANDDHTQPPVEQQFPYAPEVNEYPAEDDNEDIEQHPDDDHQTDDIPNDTSNPDISPPPANGDQPNEDNWYFELIIRPNQEQQNKQNQEQ